MLLPSEEMNTKAKRIARGYMQNQSSTGLDSSLVSAIADALLQAENDAYARGFKDGAKSERDKSPEK